ncbi:Nuclear RNA export factor 2 [Lemmus lemmus]
MLSFSERTLPPEKSYSGKNHVLLGRRRDHVSSLGHTGKRKGYYERNGTPYAVRPKNREDQHVEDQIQITVWRDGKSQKREVGRHPEDRTLGSWFKVTIPCGRKSDKTQLMKSIHSLCRVPFTTVDFQYEKQQIQFFVQDTSTACALKDVSYKMCDEDSYKTQLSFCSVSKKVPNTMTHNTTEPPSPSVSLQLALRKRYDVSQHALDLQNLHFDPDLLDQKIDTILSRRSCMTATLQIIQEDFHEVLMFWWRARKDGVHGRSVAEALDSNARSLKTVWELEKVKGLKLEELWLEGNPLCSTFPDHSAYARSDMCKYLKDEVHMKNPKEFHLQRQVLKYRKQDIVDFLRALPQTLHAFSAFQVDMCFQTHKILIGNCPVRVQNMHDSNVLLFIVFEVEESSQGCIRAFMRTFIATLDKKNSNLCIVNDQLLVRNPSPDEAQGASEILLPTSCTSFKLVSSQEQQRMAQAFSIQSGMKLEWSQKCLEDNNWDYKRAAEVFMMLQAENKIPKEFFK